MIDKELLPLHLSSLIKFSIQVPEQKVEMVSYFAMFYAAINLGSLVSTIATPYLRYLQGVFKNMLAVQTYCCLAYSSDFGI